MLPLARMKSGRRKRPLLGLVWLAAVQGLTMYAPTRPIADGLDWVEITVRVTNQWSRKAMVRAVLGKAPYWLGSIPSGETRTFRLPPKLATEGGYYLTAHFVGERQGVRTSELGPAHGMQATRWAWNIEPRETRLVEEPVVSWRLLSASIARPWRPRHTPRLANQRPAGQRAMVYRLPALPVRRMDRFG